MLSGERERLVLPEALYDMYRLFEAAHPQRCRIEGDAEAVVLVLILSSSNTKLEPAATQHVERRRFLRQSGRMAEVVVEHGACDSKSASYRRCCEERRYRRELTGEVIADQKSVIPKRLEATRPIGPVRG